MSPRNVLVFSVALGLLGLLAACGDDDVAPPLDAGADAGLDASMVCTSSAECGNGMYCDGVETCAPGTVGANARGCVAGTAPCAATETCLEDTDACRSCSIDDADGDGVSGCDADCDDTDPARYPGSTELCDYDGHDEDCDDTTFGAKDDDGDGATDARCCNGSTCGLDCDDARGGVHAGVPEVCNGRDDDCNGVVDDGDVQVAGYADADRDLYGAGPMLMACAGSGLSTNGTDCNDAPPGGGRASPGFEEVLGDGIDNDCDGDVDETGGPSAQWYRDADGDGFGDATDTQASSTILLGYVLLPGDCDDANAARSPLAAELCNGIDDDCNDELDFVVAIGDWEDDDGDGFLDAACGGAANDCDDGDRDTHPGAAELCDGRDNGCDGVVDELCGAALDGGVPDDGGTPDCVAGAPCATGNPCERGTTDCSSGSAVCVAAGPGAPGTTCRVSTDVCDVAEACDGTSTACPADGFVGAGTVCRGDSGACDVSEACTGSAAACPGDGFDGPGTVCRVAADVCDVGENCSGTGPACPADAFVGAGTECRLSAGVCDVAEACTGSAAACPSDAFVAMGTMCRIAGGLCDVAEACTGASPSCPANTLVASGTVCRADVGACDVAETCNGTLASCPADAYEPSGTTCTGGSCDLIGGCISGCSAGAPCGTGNACENGAIDCGTGSPVCVATGPKAAGTTCRAAIGICDADEICDGSTLSCPVDVFASAANECRAAVDVCDAAEFCSGSAAACPADALRPNGTVCRPDAGDCDVPETCNGSATACPSDSVVPADTACAGGSCDAVGGCAVGCFSGAPCSTGNACENGLTGCATGSAVCSSGGPKSAGTSCRGAVSLCDVAETCNGSSLTCPADAFASAATVCRAAVAACDIAETCSGSGTACPVDGFGAAGMTCRAMTAACDAREACTGSSAYCPADAVETNGTGCRAATGPCDVAEVCDGVAPSCPVNGFMSAATVCRGMVDVCDAVETCTGSEASCPADMFAGAIPCRSPTGECDSGAQCSGSSTACPASGLVPAGTACTGGTCSGDGTCVTPFYVKASNTGPNDKFGSVVALSADGLRLAVGAPFEASNATGINGDQANNTAANAGAVYVFAWSGGTWVQEAYIKGANTEAGDKFGQSVSLSADGSRLAVGAVLEDSNATGVGGDGANNGAAFSGAAYVFSRTGTTWTQEAYIKASNTGTNDFFGQAVSLSSDGTRLAVSAHGEASVATGVGGNQADNGAANSGAAYVFFRAGTTWTQEAYIKASNSQAGDYFGWAISLSGDGTRVAVGSSYEDSSATGVNGTPDESATDAGALYVYARSGTAWAQEAYVKASNTNAGDRFGEALALSGDGSRLIAGAFAEGSNAAGVGGDQGNNSLVQAGAAYVFSRTGTIWAQQAYLKASNTGSPDSFGNAVAVSGDGTRVVVGAYGEGSSATGIGGNQADNSAGSAGAAYVFAWSTGAWAQTSYVKATNSGAADVFGTRVTLSGDGMRLAVGAPHEDSNATGVNGNGADNTYGFSGAAYVY